MKICQQNDFLWAEPIFFFLEQADSNLSFLQFSQDLQDKGEQLF